MRKPLVLFWSFLLSLPFFLAGNAFAQEPKTSKAYALMLSSMYKNTVPTISQSSLSEKLRAKPEEVVLLDSRAPKEYKVSHLKGARFINYDNVKDRDLQALPKDKTLVVYCSVGYRSERIGERLKALGFKNVYNLYGGIFEWVNQGQPIVNAQGPTQKVHAYSKAWGIWLNKGEKVYE
jgi:rhodanese-related sulfurtransferase